MNLIPCLRYRDAHAAIDWLEKAFGLHRRAVYPGPDDTIAHAELGYGGAVVMVGSDRDDDLTFGSPLRVGGSTSCIYMIVSDPDAHFAQAEEAGAEIIQPLRDEEYGSRGYSAKDIEGNVWSFGTYRPN